MRPAKFDSSLKTLASSIIRKDRFYLTAIECSQQRGGNDCGLFACAFATSLLFNHDPADNLYDQDRLRTHFMRLLDTRRVITFPATYNKRRKCKPKERFSVLVDTYCHCRLADAEKTFNVRMVQCSKCNVFHHECCVDVPEIVWNGERAEYFCPICE